jgi:hypothetical protein
MFVEAYDGGCQAMIGDIELDLFCDNLRIGVFRTSPASTAPRPAVPGCVRL